MAEQLDIVFRKAHALPEYPGHVMRQWAECMDYIGKEKKNLCFSGQAAEKTAAALFELLKDVGSTVGEFIIYIMEEYGEGVTPDRIHEIHTHGMYTMDWVRHPSRIPDHVYGAYPEYFKDRKWFISTKSDNEIRNFHRILHTANDYVRWSISHDSYPVCRMRCMYYIIKGNPKLRELVDDVVDKNIPIAISSLLMEREWSNKMEPEISNWILAEYRRIRG